MRFLPFMLRGRRYRNREKDIQPKGEVLVQYRDFTVIFVTVPTRINIEIVAIIYLNVLLLNVDIWYDILSL
jgi:hypothetical protein